MSEKDGESQGSSMRPVMYSNKASEIKGIPVQECTTRKESNYAGQKTPGKGIQG